MAINLIRYRHDDDIRWGVAVAGGIAPLAGDYPTTADLIARGESDWRSAAKRCTRASRRRTSSCSRRSRRLAACCARARTTAST